MAVVKDGKNPGRERKDGALANTRRPQVVQVARTADRNIVAEINSNKTETKTDRLEATAVNDGRLHSAAHHGLHNQ